MRLTTPFIVTKLSILKQLVRLINGPFKDLTVSCIADSGQCGQSGSFVDAKCNLDFAGSRSRLAGRSGGPNCLEVFLFHLQEMILSSATSLEKKIPGTLLKELLTILSNL